MRSSVKTVTECAPCRERWRNVCLVLTWHLKGVLRCVSSVHDACRSEASETLLSFGQFLVFARQPRPSRCLQICSNGQLGDVRHPADRRVQLIPAFWFWAGGSRAMAGYCSNGKPSRAPDDTVGSQRHRHEFVHSWHELRCKSAAIAQQKEMQRASSTSLFLCSHTHCVTM